MLFLCLVMSLFYVSFIVMFGGVCCDVGVFVVSLFASYVVTYVLCVLCCMCLQTYTTPKTPPPTKFSKGFVFVGGLCRFV